MVEIRCHENRHDVIFFCWEWSDLDKISQIGPEWHVDCGDIWSKSKPDVDLQYGGRLGEFYGMSYCLLLPAGKFNVMITELRVTLQALQGAATGEFNAMSSQNHIYIYILHCRELPLAEFTVTILEPHATLQGAVTWRNQCHESWSCHIAGVIIPSGILKIVFRHNLFIFLFVLMQIGLWRAAAFVSSPIHLFDAEFS